MRINSSFTNYTRKGSAYSCPLLGAHQLRNAAVALETVAQLRKRGWHIPETAVCEGLNTTAWPARFEVLSHDPLFILDGGHNPQCAEAMARNLRDYLPGQKVTFLMGVLADKDFDDMLRLLSPYADSFLCVTPESPRALPAAALRDRLIEKGFHAQAFNSIREGVRAALQASTPVVAFGSLYLAGRVRTLFPACIKKHQRTLSLQARDDIPASVRKEKSAAICRQIRESAAYQNARTVMLFKAFRSEVDLSDLERLAEKDGKRVAYPYCIEEFQMLALHPTSKDAWEHDRYGIRVPIPERSEFVRPEQIDLVICPCSAFDDEGHRLGMGAGYYDRFLPRCKNAVIALAAFSEQRIEHVYSDAYDVPVEVVFSS